MKTGQPVFILIEVLLTSVRRGPLGSLQSTGPGSRVTAAAPRKAPARLQSRYYINAPQCHGRVLQPSTRPFAQTWFFWTDLVEL